MGWRAKTDKQFQRGISFLYPKTRRKYLRRYTITNVAGKAASRGSIEEEKGTGNMQADTQDRTKVGTKKPRWQGAHPKKTNPLSWPQLRCATRPGTLVMFPFVAQKVRRGADRQNKKEITQPDETRVCVWSSDAPKLTAHT